jgi:hypothetical protein
MTFAATLAEATDKPDDFARAKRLFDAINVRLFVPIRQRIDWEARGA